jgi:hypothetical protein
VEEITETEPRSCAADSRHRRQVVANEIGNFGACARISRRPRSVFRASSVCPSRRVAVEVRRRSGRKRPGCGYAQACCAGPTREQLQAGHADRRAHRWDGSGLLPGESLSKHRNLQDEEYRPAGQAETEVRDAQADAPEAASFAPDVVEEQEFFEEVTESGPETASLPLAVSVEEMPATAAAEDYVVEEEPETARTSKLGESRCLQTSGLILRITWTRPPTGFGSLVWAARRRSEDKAAKPAAKSAAVSSYAPGSGLIEEETIEEEEFDAPRHPHRAKGGDHESDDFEEETLPNQMRTGDLGEMLQEAHLDHRIQLNFDEKNGDEEDDSTMRTRKSLPPKASPPPDPQAQQRPDRNARGRRGRGGPPAGGQAARAAECRAAPCRPPTCPSSATCSSRARRFWSRSPRSPSPRRARASPRTSPCPAASWSSCPPSPTSASAARSPPTKSASASSGFWSTSAARPPADSSSAPPPRARRKKNSAPTCACC